MFPFSYCEYLAYTNQPAGASSLTGYLNDGGFPVYLRERNSQILQELLRDIVQRDIAARHRLRETRHVMNLALFLLANTGQPLSMQGLTKALSTPTVAPSQTTDGHLLDLAMAHNACLATLDTGIPGAELIPEYPPRWTVKEPAARYGRAA